MRSKIVAAAAGLDDRRLVLARGQRARSCRPALPGARPRGGTWPRRRRRRRRGRAGFAGSPASFPRGPGSPASALAGASPRRPLASPTIRPDAALRCDLRAELGVVRAQLVPLRCVLVEPDVQPQDGDVERDDAGQQERDEPIQTTPPATRAARRGLPLRARLRLRARAGRCGRGSARAVAARAIYAFCAARSLAEAARGLWASSCALGRIAFRFSRRSSGSRAADADGEVRRADAAALEPLEEALHDPVLERVERDHGDAAAGSQHLEGGRKRLLELAELVVDRDAERLEDALRRMARRRSAREPGSRRGSGPRARPSARSAACLRRRPIARAICFA